MRKLKLVVGIGGASGAPYARRLLEHLTERDDVEPAVVFSVNGRQIWAQEVGTDPRSYGFPIYGHKDFQAPFASGSAGYRTMVVLPCSASGMARIAQGVSDDLLGRAAEVVLKEQGKLILCVRETPLSQVHLRAALLAAEAGAMVMPASPSFYSNPQSMDDLVDTVVARVLDRIGLDNELMERWGSQPAPLRREAGARAPARVASGEDAGPAIAGTISPFGRRGEGS
ncbi:UbiX family flavin prenyltransferase [Vulgatibacter incomptus]|uniref:Flavin prenyltransferase UbiX n=1 Tax=Vulgatibacter incomptus TaxID=1391653 RepID=A0A0K1P8I2_9BACT|nr:UbiX family flavin prenyltransferase [Vulgatibacter incomptus]AKU89830.1 UbiX family decarboxylase associated with menaquinone via futalosine [Vulgatibacter incomptus]